MPLRESVLFQANSLAIPSVQQTAEGDEDGRGEPDSRSNERGTEERLPAMSIQCAEVQADFGEK